MKFGVGLKTARTPGLSPEAQADDLKRLALAAEELGFDSVWVPDRTVFPPDMTALHPERGYGPKGSIPDSQFVLEPHTVLSFLAGATSKIGLGFSVLVLPFRNPVVNAKRVTTLDVLSHGRVLFGVGVGWMPEEFEGVSASFPDRGAVTDEHIELFKAVCVGETAEYRGEHFQISGKIFYPKPMQKPHPPIWVGGRTGRAVKRSARLGDGWLPNGLGLDDLTAARRTLRHLCEENGRSPDSVQVGNCLAVHFGEAPREELPGRASLSGGAADIVQSLERFRDAGLDFAMVSFPAPSTETTLEAMRRFAVEVVPAL